MTRTWLMSIVAIGASVLCGTAQAEHKERTFVLGAGVGAGELVHAELGWFATPRMLIEARAGWLIFNPVVGVGATYSFGTPSVAALGPNFTVTAGLAF